MDKNLTGNKNSIFKTLGASNHTEKRRDRHDYYATEPNATLHLMRLERFQKSVWEPACGEGYMSMVLEQHGYTVRSTDLIDRGYGVGGVDFLSIDEHWDGDIITNPPYKYAQAFVEKSLSITKPGAKVAMFLKIQFLESKGRRSLFENNPPKTVYVSSSRLLCAKNAEFQKMMDGGGSAVAYAWFVWENGFCGDTILKWFN